MKFINNYVIYKTALILGSGAAAIGSLIYVLANIFVFQLLNPQHKFDIMDLRVRSFMFFISFLFSIAPAVGGTLLLSKLIRKQNWFGKFLVTINPIWIGFIVGFVIGAGLCLLALIIIGPHMNLQVFGMYFVEVTIITTISAGIIAARLDSELPKELPSAT